MEDVKRMDDGTLLRSLKWGKAYITVALVPDRSAYTFQGKDQEDLVLGKTSEAAVFHIDTLEFLMVFRRGYGVPIVIHECWHLFFGRMTDIDGSDDIRFSDINKEVYAYDFEDLYSTVFEALRDMKAKERDSRS